MTRATASGYSRSHVRMHPHPARLPPAFGASASSSEVTPPQAYSARPGTVDNTTAAQPAAIVAAMLFCAHHQASHGEPRRAVRKGTASRGPRVWVRLRGRRQAGAPERLQQLDVVVARLSASWAIRHTGDGVGTQHHVTSGVLFDTSPSVRIPWTGWLESANEERTAVTTRLGDGAGARVRGRGECGGGHSGCVGDHEDEGVAHDGPEGLSTSDLNVDTVKGIVTLHGKVATEAEKAQAETVARGIDGVGDVKNLLQVVPSAQREVVERSDDAIKKGVDDAFKANRRVNKSGIVVASVNKGVVLLSGKTQSLEAHLEAVEVAHAVKGVRRVATEVEVMPTS